MTLDFDTLTQDGNLRAFLRTIRAGESGQTEDAYRMMFGGGLFQAPPWRHPREAITIRGLSSTAAGAYQFLARTWDMLVGSYAFSDFAPYYQDCGAIALIAGRGALRDAMDGNFHRAIQKCGKEWASLPGSPYGQPVRTLAAALETYASYGGQIAEETA